MDPYAFELDRSIAHKVIQPGETSDCLLAPLAQTSTDIVAIKIPLPDNRYYLIENRQR